MLDWKLRGQWLSFSDESSKQWNNTLNNKWKFLLLEYIILHNALIWFIFTNAIKSDGISLNTQKNWRKLAPPMWTTSNMPCITAYVKVSYFWNNYITKLFVVLISWFSSPTLLTKIACFPAWVLFKGVQTFLKYTQSYKQSLLKGWKSLKVLQATIRVNLTSRTWMFLKAAID